MTLMNIISFVWALFLFICFIPFVLIGYISGLLFRILEHSFNIGYSCLALKYAKELNKEIQEVQSNIQFNSENYDEEEN